MDRLSDLRRFYEILARLEERLGGKLRLKNCMGMRGWPQRGVYFFFEENEGRRESGSGMRVVRVGTHAVTANSKSTLWRRLAQHRGATRFEGGNHRGSIFRLLVGRAIMQRDGQVEPGSWGIKGDASSAARELGVSRSPLIQAEAPLEAKVSRYIGQMPLLYVAVSDDPSPTSARGLVERNAIALLSNLARPPIDPPSATWLGVHCDRLLVRGSGLWNNRHVDGNYDSRFLSQLMDFVGRTRPLERQQLHQDGIRG